MWILTPDGFFSAVVSSDDANVLSVRARDRGDIDRLATTVGATVIETPHRDYRFRVIVDHATWAAYVADQAAMIDYGNFKDAVAERQGHDRARIYARVWSALLDLQRRPGKDA